MKLEHLLDVGDLSAHLNGSGILLLSKSTPITTLFNRGALRKVHEDLRRYMETNLDCDHAQRARQWLRDTAIEHVADVAASVGWVETFPSARAEKLEANLNRAEQLAPVEIEAARTFPRIVCAWANEHADCVRRCAAIDGFVTGKDRARARRGLPVARAEFLALSGAVAAGSSYGPGLVDIDENTGVVDVVSTAALLDQLDLVDAGVSTESEMTALHYALGRGVIEYNPKRWSALLRGELALTVPECLRVDSNHRS